MTPYQRQQHIEAWQKSGLSRSAYCRLHGLHATTFSGWVRRYTAPADERGPGLIPVEVRREEETDAGLVLRLSGDARLELPATVSPRWLAELLQCLG